MLSTNLRAAVAVCSRHSSCVWSKRSPQTKFGSRMEMLSNRSRCGTGRLLLGGRRAGLRRTITLNGAAQPVIDADQVTRASIGAGQSCAC